MDQRIIGLTGSIGTGKSTVASYLARKYDLPILDADVYSRQAVDLGSDILAEINHRYGSQVLQEDGSLNRAWLGKIIFQDYDEKKWLESLIHPYVRERLVRELANITSSVVVMVIPLLIESGMLDLVTEVWVVGCAFAEQLERVKNRDGLTTSEAIARIESQLPLSEKAPYADYILDNSGSTDSLYQQIDQAMKLF